MGPTEFLNPTILVPVAVVVVVVAGGGAAIVKSMADKRRARQLESWAHGAYSIWTGGEDCATWTESRARSSLANWYGASGGPAFWDVIGGLRQGTTGNVSWDRVRALDLLRIGVAARFIDAEQCWTETAKIGAELQSKYQTWEELAREFELGMHGWQRSRGVSDPQQTGRVQKNLPKLRQEIWPSVAYEVRLAAND